MRHSPEKTLLHELQAAGASESEARELQSLALQLGQLKPRPARMHKRNWKLAVPIGAAIGALAILLVVVLTRGVMPSNMLYPVQRVSDSVAIAVHPSYRATVMMRQAEQVRELVETHAPSSAVMTALNDYQHQASAYRAHYANYEVFEHCKDSLRQAANHANGQDRQAINHTLTGLQDV